MLTFFCQPGSQYVKILKNWKKEKLLDYKFFITEGEKLFNSDFDSYLDLRSFIDKIEKIIPNPTENDLEMFRVCIREGFFLSNQKWYFYPAFTFVVFGVDCIVWPEYCL